MGGAGASSTEDALSEIASEPDPWDTDEPNHARILWVKNLTRLRQQVSFLFSNFILLFILVNVDSCY